MTTALSEPVRFDPPVGLLPHEQVVVARAKGVGSNPWYGPIVVILFGLVFGYIGIEGKTPLGLVIGIGIVGLGVLIFRANVIRKNTRYFVTTFRIVRTYRGNIVHQVSRDRFKGKPMSQFLEKGPTAHFSGMTVSSIRVLDPETGIEIMGLPELSEESVNAIESMASAVYCQYCGQKNEVTRTNCSQCGASM